MGAFNGGERRSSWFAGTVLDRGEGEMHEARIEPSAVSCAGLRGGDEATGGEKRCIFGSRPARAAMVSSGRSSTERPGAGEALPRSGVSLLGSMYMEQRREPRVEKKKEDVRIQDKRCSRRMRYL